MTNTKKQLMTAIAMLVVAALALGTSTYAWFKANTTVTVEELTFQAQSVKDVSIALTTNAWDGSLVGTGMTPDTFKTLISAEDIKGLYSGIGTGVALTSAALEPASSIDGTAFYKVKPGDEAWVNDGGINKAKEFVQVQNISENSVRVIPLYLKSTSATAVTLGPNTSVVGDATPAVRIAFVSDDVRKIWAPNATGDIDGSRITTKVGASEADGISNAISGPTQIGEISNTVYTATRPTETIVNLAANTPKKLMIYIWLEGCDKDCVSGISAKDLTVNLEFTSN